MRLEWKQYPEISRSMYAVYPDGDRLSCYENTLVTVLRENDDPDELKALLRDEEFCALANRQRLILLFPEQRDGRWNADPAGGDMTAVTELIRLFNYQPDFRDCGIYHNMHNARYLVGLQSGADLVQTIAACCPQNVAGIVTVGGRLCAAAAAQTKGAPVSAVLWEADGESVRFFRALNETDTEKDGCAVNSINSAQFVKLPQEHAPRTLAGLLAQGWRDLFSQVCRPNTTEYGVMDHRLVRDDYRFLVHENDTSLGDNNGLSHTWFEYVPACVRAHPAQKVPLVLFNHGGADTPGNMANTTKFHRTAEKYGFLLVFPWSSSRWGWNHDMLKSEYDDVAYLAALIAHMKKTYAVDETRVYMAGFSNGSAMSQVFAMTHPETVAGVFADNTRFCQDRNTLPFAIASAKKLQYDWRMPVWYMYGTRDYEYPAVRGSGQQVAYDWWKSYNHIPCKETPYIAAPASCGVGVPGDVIEERFPNPQFPRRKLTTHRFFTSDPTPLNLYNYTLVDGKGHDSNPEEPELAWQYLRQFRRMPDGSLGRAED